MQTIQLMVEDSTYNTLVSRKIDVEKKINQFLSSLTMDKNLQEDPFFYERREELHQLLDDIESGNMKMYGWDEFESEMDEFESKMILKYDN